MKRCVKPLKNMNNAAPDEYRSRHVARRMGEGEGVVTLWFEPTAAGFEPGQFINVMLPGHAEAKSYSLSCAPGEKEWSITVRAAGAFSRALCALRAGDEFFVSAPLGYFYTEHPGARRLWLAGGIGIAPFRAMLRAAPQTPTLLLYSNRTAHDAVFKEELDTRATGGAFKVRHFFTRERAPQTEGVSHRIGRDDLTKALKEFSPQELFICGSIGFVRDLWQTLRSLGVPEEMLFTEAFF
jgi:ferredoxin-NADP reductase